MFSRAASSIRRIGVWILLLVTLFSFSPATAQTIAEGQCNFSARFEELDAVRSNPGLTPSKALEKELGIRREILGGAIDCATEETAALHNDLNKLVLDGGDVLGFRKNFAEQLRTAFAYYQGQRALVHRLDLKSTKDLARTVSQWRKFIYIPRTERISHFIVWANNQELIQTGERRFAQIKQTVSTLNLIQNKERETIKDFLRKAEINLRQAQDANGQAKEVFAKPDIPDDSLVLTKASLTALAEMYRNFFELSEYVNKILPPS